MKSSNMIQSESLIVEQGQKIFKQTLGVDVKAKKNNLLVNLFKDMKIGGCICCTAKKKEIEEDIQQGNFTIHDFEMFRKNYKDCLCKENIIFNNDLEDKYHLIYSSGVEVVVSRDVFKKVEGKVRVQGPLKIKYVPDTNQKIYKKKSYSKKYIKTYSKTTAMDRQMFEIFGKIKDVYSTSKDTVVTCLDNLQYMLKQIPTMSIYVNLIKNIFTPLVSMIALMSSPNLINLIAIIGNIIVMLKEFDRADKCYKHNLAKEQQYRDFFQEETFEQDLEDHEEVEEYADAQRQTLDVLMAAASVQFLPKWIQKALSSLSQLSTTKILDDTLMLARFMKVISDVVFKLLDFISKRCLIPKEIMSSIEEVLNKTCIGKYSFYILSMEHNLNQMIKDPQIVNKIVFQENVLDLASKMTDIMVDMDTFIERNSPVKQLYERHAALVKLIRSNKDITRIEPICLVLEGKPGSGKSQTMANLTACLREMGYSIYSHVTPNPKFAKDFYDDYADQDIFIMDDVGQQGNSQWCQIINLVSPIKYGLPCANAALKQTKYMSSKVLLCTTNKLKDIVFTKDDCVNEPDALFRRCDILDFRNVDMKLNEKGFKEPSGYIQYRHFIQATTTTAGYYSDGFSEGFSKFTKIQPIFHYTDNKTESQLKWILSIITDRLKYKKMENEEIKLDMNNILEGLTRQSLITELPQILTKYFIDPLTDFTMQYLPTLMTSIACSIKSLTPTNCIKNQIISLVLFIIFAYFGHYAMTRALQMIHNSSNESDPRIAFQQVIKEAEKYVSSKEPTTADIKISKQVKYLTYTLGNKQTGQNIKCGTIGLISGGCVITPFHILYEAAEANWDIDKTSVYATIYSDPRSGMVMYDNVLLTVLVADSNEDFIVWELPKTISALLPDVSNLLAEHDQISNMNCKLITPTYIIDLKEQIKTQLSGLVYYDILPGLKGDLASQALEYQFGIRGACGSILTDGDGKIRGMHVAGSQTIETRGFSRIWSIDTLTQIKQFLTNSKHIRYSCKINEKEPGKEEMSVVKLENEEKLGASVPKFSKYVPSAVAGLYPITRAPVNLDQENIIKDMAKKSYKKVADIDCEALAFAEQYMESIIPQFTKVTEKEIVLGTNLSSKMDKNTSCGFGFPKGKEEYINYETGAFKPGFRVKMQDFKEEINRQELDIKNILYTETLKDELRDLRKVNKPRCFKMSPLLLTCLGREYFLNLIDKLRETRFETGIMIGTNPFSDWQTIYDKAMGFGNKCNDGDYGEWDGSMLTQFQTMLARLLVRKYQDQTNEFDIKCLQVFLCTLINTPTLNMNELLVTTHSMPSGCMLTATFNCLINKAYGAYIYYKICKENLIKPSIIHFTMNVFSMVYGDDLLMFIREALIKIFNGITYQKHCRELGLDYTTADKISEMKEYKSIEECQFLKRGFKFNSFLNTITCPLDEISMFGTINFVSDVKRKDELTQVKLCNLQREMILHGLDFYNYHIKHIRTYFEIQGKYYTLLDLDYIKRLYCENKDEYIQGLSWDRPYQF